VFIPLIGARFAFEDAKQAYRAMAERRFAGKIVLEV
jgi:NADPH:quinone reductase-like Zn-dependent oxidoreductase